MDTTEMTMSSMPAATDGPAPIFGRTRARTSAGTYWKCHIGNRVHLAREKAWGRDAHNRPALTRETLARRLDMPAQRLWEIEAGILPLEGAEIARVAEALNIHPGSLFDDAPIEHWAMTARGTPAWLLATTIGQMDLFVCVLLVVFVIRLDARRSGKPA